MRSTLHGTFATLLLLIPVGAIPALAIFGIPQFAPVVASPRHEGHDGDRERREGRSARGPADDLFQDDEDFAARSDGSLADRGANATSGRLGDAVAVPVRHASQGVASDPRGMAPRDLSEQPSRGAGQRPTWADDLPVDARPASSSRANSHFDRYASNSNDVPAQHEPDLKPFTPGSTRRDELPAARRNMSGAASGGDIQQAASEAFTAAGPPGFQRQRELNRDRTAAVPSDEMATAPLTWKSAVHRLNSLEIRNFRIEPGRQPSQFIFICSYTPTDSPRVSYRFEAEADEPLKAVEKVLVQISDWQQRR